MKANDLTGSVWSDNPYVNSVIVISNPVGINLEPEVKDTGLSIAEFMARFYPSGLSDAALEQLTEKV